MASYLRVCVWFLLFPALWEIPCGYADRIYLKDGTVQESDRVWLDEKYVHFILKGTEGVAIRYAKEIVDRVIIGGVVEMVAVKPSSAQPGSPEPIGLEVSVPKKEELPATPSTAVKTPTQTKFVDQNIVREHKGVSFYNPRRDRRYWVTRDSKYSALNAALVALAKIYGQPVEWVEAHMGDENDLGAIHRNLILSKGKTPDVPAATTADAATTQDPLVSEGRFYNSGRALPYSIGPNQTFKSQSAAVKALARQYGQTLEWVQENFGQSNELKTIHQNLTRAKQAPVTPVAREPKEEIAISPAADMRVKGKKFYDPRRQDKYWIGEKGRYNALEDALNALAKKYGVPVEWVERHMGATNDLTQIHQNLQESLK